MARSDARVDFLPNRLQRGAAAVQQEQSVPVLLRWERVLAWRLARQYLDNPVAGLTAADISQRLLGLHAQLQSTAEWSAMVRTQDRLPSDVPAALEAGSLVKTWMMRGTLHLLKAEDLPLFVAARHSYRPSEAGPALMRYHGVTPALLDRVHEAVPAALSGRRLTRAELAREVARIAHDPSLVAPLESGWGSLLKWSAYAGHLCFGPPAGRQVTFIHAREHWPHLPWGHAFRPGGAGRDCAPLPSYVRARHPRRLRPVVGLPARSCGPGHA